MIKAFTQGTVLCVKEKWRRQNRPLVSTCLHRNSTKDNSLRQLLKYLEAIPPYFDYLVKAKQYSTTLGDRK